VIRAYIREPYLGLTGIDVVIVNHIDDQVSYLMRIGDQGQVIWDEPPNDFAEPKPTFSLPADTGRVLLDALVRHYQGAEDSRSLRRDYDAERQRVDEQAKVLADVARTLAGKVGA
jgi:hypothetical protein